MVPFDDPAMFVDSVAVVVLLVDIVVDVVWFDDTVVDVVSRSVDSVVNMVLDVSSSVCLFLRRHSRQFLPAQYKARIKEIITTVVTPIIKYKSTGFSELVRGVGGFAIDAVGVIESELEINDDVETVRDMPVEDQAGLVLDILPKLMYQTSFKYEAPLYPPNMISLPALMAKDETLASRRDGSDNTDVTFFDP